MYMGYRGQRLSHRMIHGPLRHLATFYVGDRNSQSQRHRCGGQHLVSVRYQEHQIWTLHREDLGQRKHCQTDRLGHTYIGVAAEQALDPMLNLEPISFDFTDRHAELWRQVRTHHGKTQIDLFILLQLPQWRGEVTPIGSAGGQGQNFSGAPHSSASRSSQVAQVPGSRRLSTTQARTHSVGETPTA